VLGLPHELGKFIGRFGKDIDQLLPLLSYRLAVGLLLSAAATMARLRMPTQASAFRMKCTRQRCQEAPSTLAAATLSPSCASLMTSLTPRRPRPVSERRNSVQNASASEASR